MKTHRNEGTSSFLHFFSSRRRGKIMFLAIMACLATFQFINNTQTGVIVQTKRSKQDSTKKKTNATHFFDCDGLGSHCNWFHPVDFFASEAGRAFESFASSQAYGSPTREIPANFARIRLKDPILSPPETHFPPDLTYIHIRKVAGTTMKFALQQFSGSSKIGKNYTTDVVYYREERELGEQKFMEYVKSFMTTTLFFSFVRDPIDKFVSGSNQIVKARRITSCQLVNDERENMKCFLKVLKEKQFVDEHLAPQIIDLYQMTMGENVPIALLTLDKLNTFFSYIGIQPFISNSRKVGNYTKQNLDKEMIEDICKVYAMDVLMLKSIGVHLMYCA